MNSSNCGHCPRQIEKSLHGWLQIHGSLQAPWLSGLRQPNCKNTVTNAESMAATSSSGENHACKCISSSSGLSWPSFIVARTQNIQQNRPGTHVDAMHRHSNVLQIVLHASSSRRRFPHAAMSGLQSQSLIAFPQHTVGRLMKQQ